MRPGIFLAGTALALAQTQIKPVLSQRTVNEQVNVVRLAPRYATAIRLPEAVSSVVVGDPSNSWRSIPTKSRRWCW